MELGRRICDFLGYSQFLSKVQDEGGAVGSGKFEDQDGGKHRHGGIYRDRGNDCE